MTLREIFAVNWTLTLQQNSLTILYMCQLIHINEQRKNKNPPVCVITANQKYIWIILTCRLIHYVDILRS